MPALVPCSASLATGLVAAAHGQARDARRRRSSVALLVDLDGAVGPPACATSRAPSARRSRTASVELIILRMNTPGGLVTSMREMIAAIIASRVPVVGYVAPSGARAASAGTYILYATNIAAMAPGTNVGAATPISLGGRACPAASPTRRTKRTTGKAYAGDPQAKAVNDAVAFIRSLAELRGRNVKWAEEAVRKAVSISANEALKLGVIDLIADDVDEPAGRRRRVQGQNRQDRADACNQGTDA